MLNNGNPIHIFMCNKQWQHGEDASHCFAMNEMNLKVMIRIHDKTSSHRLFKEPMVYDTMLYPCMASPSPIMSYPWLMHDIVLIHTCACLYVLESILCTTRAFMIHNIQDPLTTSRNPTRSWVSRYGQCQSMECSPWIIKLGPTICHKLVASSLPFYIFKPWLIYCEDYIHHHT